MVAPSLRNPDVRGSSDPTRLSAGLASWSLIGPLSGGWTLSLPPRWQTSEPLRLPGQNSNLRDKATSIWTSPIHKDVWIRKPRRRTQDPPPW